MEPLTQLDPGIVERYAEHLARRASARVIAYTIFFALVGAMLGSVPLIAPNRVLIPHSLGLALLLVGAAAGGYLGYTVGVRRAEGLRLQAQVTLHQLRVEMMLVQPGAAGVRMIDQLAQTAPPPVVAAPDVPTPAPAPAPVAPAPVAPTPLPPESPPPTAPEPLPAAASAAPPSQAPAPAVETPAVALRRACARCTCNAVRCAGRAPGDAAALCSCTRGSGSACSRTRRSRCACHRRCAVTAARRPHRQHRPPSRLPAPRRRLLPVPSTLPSRPRSRSRLPRRRLRVSSRLFPRARRR